MSGEEARDMKLSEELLHAQRLLTQAHGHIGRALEARGLAEKMHHAANGMGVAAELFKHDTRPAPVVGITDNIANEGQPGYPQSGGFQEFVKR